MIPFLFLLIAFILILLIRYFVAKAKCQEVLNLLAAEIPLQRCDVQDNKDEFNFK